MGKKPREQDPKLVALRAAGALNPSPAKVQDEAFRQHEFFDPRDRVQVKYEMLRRRRVDGRSVTEVVAAFGTSRQTFYVSQGAFEKRGLVGLLPRRRGPKGPHKCSEEMLAFVRAWRLEEGEKSDAAMVEGIQRRFGIVVHPRTVRRALARREKKRRPTR